MLRILFLLCLASASGTNRDYFICVRHTCNIVRICRSFSSCLKKTGCPIDLVQSSVIWTALMNWSDKNYGTPCLSAFPADQLCHIHTRTYIYSYFFSFWVVKRDRSAQDGGSAAVLVGGFEGGTLSFSYNLQPHILFEPSSFVSQWRPPVPIFLVKGSDAPPPSPPGFRDVLVFLCSLWLLILKKCCL